MDIMTMSKKDFQNLPYRKSWSSLEKGRGIVLIPTRRKFDSGYMTLDAALLDEDLNPVCRLSGCSDVINIDPSYHNHTRSEWKIDLLPCGYFHLWCRDTIYIDHALSSLGIFSAACVPDYLKGE